MSTQDPPEAPATAPSLPSLESPAPSQTTWGRLMGVADDLARQLDRLTEMLEGGPDFLASDALVTAMDKFGEIENRLQGELDRFTDRFSHTPGFQAAQKELWETPEPPRRKKKPVPPPPEPKKRGRPRKNPVGAGG